MPFSVRHFSRPQGKVIFSQASVCPQGVSPLEGHSPDRSPLDKDPPLILTSSGDDCSVRCVSCWNAFLSLRYSKVVPESESVGQYLYYYEGLERKKFLMYQGSTHVSLGLF